MQSYSLPANVAKLHKECLKGSWVLQIETVANIGVENERRTEEKRQAGKKRRRVLKAATNADAGASAAGDSSSSSEDGGAGPARYAKRMLKVGFTDGSQTIYGIELRHVKELGHMAVGQKALLTDARVLRGVIMLEPKCFKLIGGTTAVVSHSATRRPQHRAAPTHLAATNQILAKGQTN